MNNYIVGYVIHTPGRVDDRPSVIPVTYDLRDAIEVCREEQARVLPIGTEFHVYRLEQVPDYIETADLANGPGQDWGGEVVAEMRPEFADYLESSEALDQDCPLDDCTCGHTATIHLHGPDRWGECDAEDCDCEMYLSVIDSQALDIGSWWQ